MVRVNCQNRVRKKGSFQTFGKGAFSEKSSFREFRDSRDSRELLDCGKQRRIRPFSRDSREFRDFRDSRDSSSEKTPFVMTPFSGSDKSGLWNIFGSEMLQRTNLCYNQDGQPQGCENGNSLEVLRKVLPRVLWEIGGDPESAPEGAVGNRGAPESAPEGALPDNPEQEEHPREHFPEHPDFPQHPREHFPEHFQGIPVSQPFGWPS